MGENSKKMLAIARETKGLLKALSTWAKSQGMAKSVMNQYPGTGGTYVLRMCKCCRLE